MRGEGRGGEEERKAMSSVRSTRMRLTLLLVFLLALAQVSSCAPGSWPARPPTRTHPWP